MPLALRAFTGSPQQAWQALDQRLLNAKHAVIASDKRPKIRSTNLSELIRLEEERADERAKQLFQAAIEVWETQGYKVCPAFCRAVFENLLDPMLETRKDCVIEEMNRTDRRINHIGRSQGARRSFVMSMGRLRSLWSQRTFITGLESEYAAKRDEETRGLKLEPSALQSTPGRTWLESQIQTGKTLEGSGAKMEPGQKSKTALLSKYRSELKRAVLVQLTKSPKASDLDICRNLDDDGSAELPKTWRTNPGDRSFEEAYKNRDRRRRIEITISKIRADLRKSGLLPGR